jgi:hypothetical protein
MFILCIAIIANRKIKNNYRSVRLWTGDYGQRWQRQRTGISVPSGKKQPGRLKFATKSLWSMVRGRKMLIFPAIDIRGGKCVRLTEGRFDQETVFADDPAEMAVRFSEAGAEFIHVVDLDGARSGGERNLATIKRILAASKIPIEVGGGIRSMETVSSFWIWVYPGLSWAARQWMTRNWSGKPANIFPTRWWSALMPGTGRLPCMVGVTAAAINYIELAKQMAAFGCAAYYFYRYQPRWHA